MEGIEQGIEDLRRNAKLGYGSEFICNRGLCDHCGKPIIFEIKSSSTLEKTIYAFERVWRDMFGMKSGLTYSKFKKISKN